MSSEPLFRQRFDICGRDYTNGGRASIAIKGILREIGIHPSVIRRVAIASYEAEMNVVLYAHKGAIELKVTPKDIRITVEDEGPGIPDVELAMQEGYSTASDEIREMGFGAGMGLPNIKKNADTLAVDSVLGKGTTVDIMIRL
jgi:anti-sigma regulatory factor (Ser/Thr protein kinase)